MRSKEYLEKPYYRIMRPLCNNRGGTDYDYMLDRRYAGNRFELCRSYNVIINDFKKVFEYIEPNDDNMKTYSYRLYELLLRIATECESNFKLILKDNGYSKKSDWNIKDYFLINKSSKLSDYEVKLEFQKFTKTIKPFINWTQSHKLKWYQDYNDVKHNRHSKFDKASFENVLWAITGLTVILFSQFDNYIFGAYQNNQSYNEDDDGFVYGDESIFSVKSPDWSDEEKYNFDWESTKIEKEPFIKFDFKKSIHGLDSYFY